MDYYRLTEEQQKSFENDGFLVVRKALDPETTGRLLRAGDELALSFLHEPENNYLDLRPNLLGEEPFLDLVSHASTVSLLAQLLTPNIHLHSTSLLYKKPEAPDIRPRRSWHRDIRIPGDLGHQSLPLAGIKVCYCLNDFDEPNSGMTLMIRGSHRRNEPLEIPRGEVEPPGADLFDPVMKAGDAILFENRIFHTKAPNLSNRVSRVAIYGYSYRWMRPEIYIDTLDPWRIQNADPITRQLLGAYRDIDSKPKPLIEWAERNGVNPDEVPWTIPV